MTAVRARTAPVRGKAKTGGHRPPLQQNQARHDKMVNLVDRMLQLNKQKHSGKLAPSQVERVDREIAATGAEIDNLAVRRRPAAAGSLAKKSGGSRMTFPYLSFTNLRAYRGRARCARFHLWLSHC